MPQALSARQSLG